VYVTVCDPTRRGVWRLSVAHADTHFDVFVWFVCMHV